MKKEILQNKLLFIVAISIIALSLLVYHWWDGSQKAGTLTRTSDQQFMPDKGRLQCVIEQAGTDFLCYENHAPDSRIKSVEVSQSIVARMGTGGSFPYDAHGSDSRGSS